MSKGISSVIIALVLLLIAVSLVSSLYIFSNESFGEVTTEGTKAVTGFLNLSDVSFVVESYGAGSIYVRNIGKNPISNITLFVNGNPLYYTMTPSVINRNEIAKITIPNYMGRNLNTIKLTSGKYASAQLLVNKDFFCKYSGLILCMDESIKNNYISDLSSSGNNIYIADSTAFGPADGFPPTMTDGRIEKALSMADNDDYSSFSSSSVNTMLTNKQFTIEFWLKTSKPSTILMWKPHGASPPCEKNWMIWADASGRIAWYGSQNSCSWTWTITGTTNVADNNWHHVAIVFNNAAAQGVKLYVDGNFEGQSTADTVNSVCCTALQTVCIASNICSINNYGSPVPYKYIGLIDEVRIWNKALTQQEISNALVP